VSDANAVIREASVTRILDAPRGAVWNAWTYPEQAKRWFMPYGFTVLECTIDLRPGGRIHMVIRDPEGNESTSDGEILELDPPERLVITEVAFDGALATRTTVTFKDLDGTKTELRLHAEVTTSSAEFAGPLAGMEEGWFQSFEKLDALLSGKDTRTDVYPRSVSTRSWSRWRR
jgi:uncharacterized protein YndB with AHSA1/START domain